MTDLGEQTYIARFLAHFQSVESTSACTWRALCPAHPDSNPSLDIKFEHDKFLLTCRSHSCTYERILRRAGLQASDGFYQRGSRANGNGATPIDGPALVLVKDLAATKHLPVEWLQERFQLRDDVGTILIPYWDTRGTFLAHKKRHGAGHKWPTGVPLAAYGAWQLPGWQLREAPYLVLVEGESDTWAGTYHDVPTLGLPGANTPKATLQAEHVQGVAQLYVVCERDDGGPRFVVNVRERLAAIEYAGPVSVIQMPEGCKDLCDLHVAAADDADFEAQWTAVLEAATPISEFVAPPEPEATTTVDASTWIFHDAADQWTFPRQEWLIDQLLPRRGVAWEAGVPHSGKSLFALYCSLAIAAGRPEVADHFTIRQRPKILFVSKEDGGDRLAARRADILMPWGLTPELLPRGA